MTDCKFVTLTESHEPLTENILVPTDNGVALTENLGTAENFVALKKKYFSDD